MTATSAVPAAGRTEVLIVGGGLVGLSAALFLDYHGVRCTLVERREDTSPLPRSRGVHTRTVELFRQIGVEEQLQETASAALKMGLFGGAVTGPTMIDAERLDIRRSRGGAQGDDSSPSSFSFCPQGLLEPLLRRIAVERGGDVRFRTELTGFDRDSRGVRAVLRDAAGRSTELRADFLIAADGGASGVRSALSIATSGPPATHHYLNIFFRADLTEYVRGRTFSQCEIANDQVRGLLLSKNNTDEWSFHLEYDPARATPADFPPERCAQLLRAAIGLPDLKVELLSGSPWDTAVSIADHYRAGPVFLAGDAAHQHAPWGGFNANTGIADVHNLSWKLAAVLRGRAADPLLDTYQQERRPRAVLAGDQARLRTDFRARYGIRTPGNAADCDRQLDLGAVMERYRYESSAIVPDGAGGPWVEELAGQAGTRAPHAWLLRDGGRVSSLDLVGPGFALLTGPDGAAWAAAADAVRVPLAVHTIGGGSLSDPGGEWLARTGLPRAGALLVRPDGHVAARLEQGPTAAALGSAMATAHASEGV